MSDMNKRGPDCDDDCEDGERGERGKRGKRGHRGHDGHDGHDGRDGETGPTGPTGATGPSRLIAAANVRADGFELAGFGFSSIAHPAVGIYLLTLANPPLNDDAVVPTALMKNFTGIIKALPTAGGVITIIIQQVNFLAIDEDFFIHVVDVTPGF